MPFAILMLAAARCASTGACPSDAELLSASWDWDMARAGAAVAAAEARDEIVLVHPRPPLRIKDVACGDGTDADVSCAMVAHYADGASHRVVRLTRGNAGWRIVDLRQAWQPRRR